MKHNVIKLSGDKSLSHRALMLSSIARGKSKIENLCDGLDVSSTIDCLRLCGASIQKRDQVYYINSENLSCPSKHLNCGNSGTTIRLLAGLLAGQGISATLYGDKSLMSRPMNRVIAPLIKMGANIVCQNNKISIKKSKIFGGKIINETSSAQVKSAIIMAALGSINKTKLCELNDSRDHTEIMIEYLSNNCLKKIGRNIIIKPTIIRSRNFIIPGDISKASFLIGYSCLSNQSQITFKNLLVNPLRMGFVLALKRMGADISVIKKFRLNGELIGDVVVNPSKKLKNIQISSEEVVKMIDEVPILAVIASFSSGVMEINGISELKLKESNRVNAIIHNLNEMGVIALEEKDKIVIKGKKKLYNTSIKTFSDHRIAMSFYIASLFSFGRASFDDLDCIDISFPSFFKKLKEIES